MISQLRGNVYLQEILSDGSLKAAIKICTDSLDFGLATESWTHINKCGPVDVEDARGTKSNSASVTMVLAEMQDKIFALGVLGTIVAEGTSGTVVSEELPGDLVDGDFYFLGGGTRHRNITGLTITGMTVTTDYTLDAVSGLVTFIGDQSASPPPTASYGYTDPQYVSLLTAGQKNYFMSYEFIDKQNANDPGSYEFYKVRFDPADNVGLQGDENQSMTFKGSALADTARAVDSVLGQFGRRVL